MQQDRPRRTIALPQESMETMNLNALSRRLRSTHRLLRLVDDVQAAPARSGRRRDLDRARRSA